MTRFVGIAKRLALPGLIGALLVTVQGVGALPPSASIDPPTTSQGGCQFAFTAQTSDLDEDITAIDWDFEYGGTPESFTVDASGSEAAHTYQSSEPRTVALRVTDDQSPDEILGNNDPVIVQRGVDPNNGRPTARVSGAPNPAALNQAVTFSGASSSDPN